MAEVTDIFISYAHPDDQAPPGSEYGIVTRLEKFLNVVMVHKYGTSRKLEIFLDTKMVSGQRWEDELVERARRARVFMPILSPVGIDSAWGQLEWREFLEKCKSRLHNRIPIVPITFQLGDSFRRRLTSEQTQFQSNIISGTGCRRRSLKGSPWP